MSRVLLLPGPETECAVTEHALEGYGQHVRPHLYGMPDELYADLERMVRRCGTVSARPPDWVRENWDGGGVSESAWWVLCGDVVLAVAENSTGRPRLVATTVLTKGGISAVARHERNRKRSQRTYRQRTRKRLDSKLSRGARILPETDHGE